MFQGVTRAWLFAGLMSVVAASAFAQASTDSIETEGIRFGTGASIGAITEKMRITQDGKVGIGTTAPQATLQVSGSFIVSTSTQTTTPSLYVGTNGYVGVGTALPKGSLHVHGSIHMTAGGEFQRALFWNGSGWEYSQSTQPPLVIRKPATNITQFMVAPEGTAGTTAGATYTALAFNGSNGNVGIGTTGPIAKLDVTGNVSVSGVIDIGHTALACSTTISGSIRYETTSDTLQICTSAGWKSLVSGTTAGGASALSGLTDVTISNVAGRDYLRYDSVSSKWVNVSESTAMSTTTMVSGWPDAIICSYPANYRSILYFDGRANDGYYYYRNVGYPNEYMRWNITTGEYVGATAGWGTGYDCMVSMPSNYAAGRAFNFIGGSTVAVSSTGAIQFNSGNAFAGDTSNLFWDDANNRLGIGTTTPTVALHVVGDVAYTGVMSDVSDRRMKRDITALDAAMADRLMLLKPVTFRMKEDDRREYGFIAQDVQEVFPELVVEGNPLSLNYVGLIAPAVKTIQLLKAENREQGDRIDALAEQNRLLRAQMKDLTLEFRKLQRDVRAGVQ